MPAAQRKRRVVIVGGGFGGLTAARALRGARDLEVVLVDRRNHHLFQPLLYEVATAALSPAEIAVPLRYVLRRQRNATVVLGEVERVDLEQRRVIIDGEPLAYDWLVLATGVRFSYFGHDDWERHAPGLKSLQDALRLRHRYLLSFELANRVRDPERAARLMTTVIVGGGPTGLELAGTMAEISRHVLGREFHDIDATQARVVLIEAGRRLLPAYDAQSSERARADLERLGVTVRLGDKVVGIEPGVVRLESGERIEAGSVIWAAGTSGDAPAAGLEQLLDRGGRIPVEPNLGVPGHPEVLVVGDLARLRDPRTGREVPGLAPAAIQMGRYTARAIRRAAASRPAPAGFRYRDKGTMATYGRGKAVAEIAGLHFGGYAAWLLWVFIHIFFLIGFRSKVMVILEWAYSYVTFRRGARLITADVEMGERPRGGEPTEPPVDESGEQLVATVERVGSGVG